MTQWYYAKGGIQAGPVTLDELRSLAAAGTLQRSDLVWNQSMKDWLPAGTVEAIFSVGAASGAPSLPAADPSNPYATPDSTWQPGSFSPTATVLEEIPPGSEPLDVIACIKRGFDLTTRHFGIIVLTGLVYFAVTFGVGVLFSVVEMAAGGKSLNQQFSPEGMAVAQTTGQTVVGVIHQIISQLLSIYLSMGATRIALNLISGQEVSVGQLFSQGDKFLKMIGASIIYFLAVGVGMLLLIVPGIYIALRFGQYQAAIVDRNMGIMEAFNYSSSLTTNNRMSLLGLGILSFLVVLAGLLALCIGVIFTMPIAWLSWVVAYRWLQYGHRAVLDHPGTTRPMLG